MNHALIIAGGSGSRLWPLSRESRPKPFLPMADGRSLLEQAWSRLDGLVERPCRWVCAAEPWRAEVTGLLDGLEDARYLGEPEGRNTLAALAFSCTVIERVDPDALVAVFTADHVIDPPEALRASFAAGFRLIQRRPDVLLTFGITPTFPSTEYGYLELGEAAGDEGARIVLQFREKPDLPTAESFLAAGPGRFLWNSGMFLWRARTFLDLVGRSSSRGGGRHEMHSPGLEFPEPRVRSVQGLRGAPTHQRRPWPHGTDHGQPREARPDLPAFP